MFTEAMAPAPTGPPNPKILNFVPNISPLGVGQTRITRIERDPTAVSVEQLLALLGALGVQMVLRPTGLGAAAGHPEAGSQPKPTRAAAAKRRPADEPW